MTRLYVIYGLYKASYALKRPPLPPPREREKREREKERECGCVACRDVFWLVRSPSPSPPPLNPAREYIVKVSNPGHRLLSWEGDKQASCTFTRVRKMLRRTLRSTKMKRAPVVVGAIMAIMDQAGTPYF